MAQLPFRMSLQLERALGTARPVLSVLQPDPLGPPRLKGVLARRVAADVSFVLKVQSGNGIPLATASVDMARGDLSFETNDLVFLGMEGYAHLAPAARQSVEDRVWSRRASVIGSLLQSANASRVQDVRATC
jgi:hypothetical protein